MSKNREIKPKEKVDIVRRCKKGEISIGMASQEASVDKKTIRRWIARYETEGAAGFLPHEQNRIYSAEMKEQAVQDYLSGGGSLVEISKKYKLRSDFQLREWIRLYHAHNFQTSLVFS